MDTSPHLCHVKGRARNEPSTNFTISEGTPESRVFVTETCAADNNRLMASTRKEGKLNNKIEYEAVRSAKPTGT